MTCALNKTLVENSSIIYSLTGRFLDTSSFFINDNNKQNSNNPNDPNLNEDKSHQILAIKNDRFEIYDIIQDYGLNPDYKIDDSEKHFKHRLITEYKVYGNIITAEKIPTKRYKHDIIVLLVDYAKLVFLYFDKKNLSFKIICLYNFQLDLPPFSLGKSFLKTSKNNYFLNLTYSKTYESLIFSCFEKNLIILKLKSIFNIENFDNFNSNKLSNDNQFSGTFENQKRNNSSNNINNFNNNLNQNSKLTLDLDYVNENAETNENLIEEILKNNNTNSRNIPNRKTSFNENSASQKRNNEDNYLFSAQKDLQNSESKNFSTKNINNINSVAANNNINNHLNINEVLDHYAESINGFYLFEPSIVLDLGGLNKDSFSSSNQINKASTNADELNQNLNNPNVKRIIKFYPFNKNNEAIDFDNFIKCENPYESIQMLLLYEEISSPILTENPNIHLNNSQFAINKINLAFISINKLNRSLENFQIVYEDLNQNSYDLLWFSNRKIVFIFSPYALQIINMTNWENKQLYSVLINTAEPVQNAIYYAFLNTKQMNSKGKFPVNNQKNQAQQSIKTVFEDKNFVNLNLDLRGGAILPISDSQFIFTSSKGGLFVFTAFEINQQINANFGNANFFNNNINNNNNVNNQINSFYSFKIEQIKIKEKNEYLQFIGAPYNTLLLPHKEVFFLSSPFADSVLINFQGAKYIITDRITSLAPIHHFHSYFDRLHTKYFLTSGIDKESYMGFLYKNFFFEITKMIPLDDINYIKSINLFPEKNTQFIVSQLKRGELLVYEVKSNAEIINISEKINFLGGKIHALAAGLNVPGNFTYKSEIKFLKAEVLTLFNFEKYMNKNPEINILGVNPILHKFGANNPVDNLNKNNLQNSLVNEYVLFVFENALQIFNKQFGLITTLKLEDIIISSFKSANFNEMKIALEGNSEKEIIKDAFVYYDQIVIYTFSGKVFLLKLGYANHFDIDFNIESSHEISQKSSLIFLPYKHSQNIPINEFTNKEVNEINKKNYSLIFNILQMNKEIINFLNINKKLLENSTHFEMNYPVNTLENYENEIIGDVNSFKQMDNILFFKAENITSFLNAEETSKSNFNNTESIEIDDSKALNINNDNGKLITNVYVNSVNYSSKIMLKNSLEKALSNMNSNAFNLINSNPGYLIGAPFMQSFNNIIYDSNDDVREQIRKIKNNVNKKFKNLFISVYRENNNLDIYKINLASFGLKIDKLVEKVFNSENISELPCLLSDCRIQSNASDYKKTLVDPTLEINLPNNTSQNLNLAMPEQIFFDFLNQKLVLAILFKNGILEKQNFFIRFDNIGKHAGLLFNLKGHQKLLFEINGKLKFIEIENNPKFKRMFNCFSEFSVRDKNENGFIFHEGGNLKVCRVINNYQITNCGILRRNKLKRFIVQNNILRYLIGNFYNYYVVNIEKESRPTLINISNANQNVNQMQVNNPIGNVGQAQTMIVNKNIYYLTLRTEEIEKIDELEFPSNYVISESKIIELYDSNQRQTVQRIAIAINILDEKGEEGIVKSLLQLYNIEQSKFVKLYEKELSKGIITMLYSIEGSLIIGEGSRINIYEYSPLNEIKILSYIENKNISVCSKAKHKFIITGDLLQSVTWIHFRQDQSHRDRPYMYLKGIDYSDYSSTAVEFWNDESEEAAKSGCLLADREDNLHIFVMESDFSQKTFSTGMNQNIAASAYSSSKLTEYADIHLGKKITEIKYYNDCEEKKRGVNFYSADDGSIGYIRPVSKDAYNCLFMLCEFIYNHFPFKAGLNPKMFFSCKYLNRKDKSNILDMSVLRIYLDLPLTTQKIIAKNITLKRENIIQLINQINDF